MRELKESFLIRYDGATQEAYRRVLEKISPYEERLRKDAADFTPEEAELFLYAQMSGGVYNIRNMCIVLSVYADYVLSLEAMPAHPNYWRQVRDYQKFVRKAACAGITRHGIASLCAAASDPLLAYALWAVFEGVGARDVGEIVSLRMSDFKDGYVTVGERRFEVSGALLEAARQSSEETSVFFQDGRSFRAVHQNGSIWYSRKLYDDTPEARRYSFYNFISRKKRIYGNILNVVAVQKAGMREYYRQLFAQMPVAAASRREEYELFRIRYDLPQDIYAVIRMMKWD